MRRASACGHSVTSNYEEYEELFEPFGTVWRHVLFDLSQESAGHSQVASVIFLLPPASSDRLLGTSSPARFLDVIFRFRRLIYGNRLTFCFVFRSLNALFTLQSISRSLKVSKLLPGRLRVLSWRSQLGSFLRVRAALSQRFSSIARRLATRFSLSCASKKSANHNEVAAKHSENFLSVQLLFRSKAFRFRRVKSQRRPFGI